MKTNGNSATALAFIRLFVVLGLAIFGILWIQGAEHEQWNAIGERFAERPTIARARTDLCRQRKCLGDFSTRL